VDGTAVTAAGVKKPFAEVHIGHGSNVVVLQHLLRFSHRPRYPAAIPPARDPRTQGPRPELLGYTMVAEPVVTEQYDEIIIPLDLYSHDDEFRKDESAAQSVGGSSSSSTRAMRVVRHARVQRLMTAVSRLEGCLRATLRRQLSLSVDVSSSPPGAFVSPLTNGEAQTLGHPGGISSWPHVLDYGNGIERDTAYTAAYLSSVCRSANEEGWLAQALRETRKELFLSAAPLCAAVRLTRSAGDDGGTNDCNFGASTKAEKDEEDVAVLQKGIVQKQTTVMDSSSSISRSGGSGTMWVTALEYDLASLLMQLPSVTIHDVFFDVLLPRAEEIGAAVWADLRSGMTQLCAVHPHPTPTHPLGERRGSTEDATVKAAVPLWGTSALHQLERDDDKEEEKKTQTLMSDVCSRWKGRLGPMLPLSAANVPVAYPLCVVRSTDTGIAVLRSLPATSSPAVPATATVSNGGGATTHNTPSPLPASSTSSSSPPPPPSTRASSTVMSSVAHHSLHSNAAATAVGRSVGGSSNPLSLHVSSSNGSHQHTHQEAFMASLLRDGQSRGSFGHDGDVAQLLSWKASLETSIEAMRVEVARRQAASVLEDL
jgi:hypothetical protein